MTLCGKCVVIPVDEKNGPMLARVKTAQCSEDSEQLRLYTADVLSCNTVSERSV